MKKFQMVILSKKGEREVIERKTLFEGISVVFYVFGMLDDFDEKYSVF